MKMQSWLNARSAELLTAINNTPLTDDSDEIKMQLIMSAMRESSIEMFQRAAENSRREIEKINNEAMVEAIQDVESTMADGSNLKVPAELKEAKEDKPEPKIKLSSSVIRRVDSF